MRRLFILSSLLMASLLPLVAEATSLGIFPFTNLAAIPSIKHIQGISSNAESRIAEIPAEPSSSLSREDASFQAYIKAFPAKPTDNQYFRQKHKENADANDADAQYALGQMYMNGNGSLADSYQSFDYLLQAAKNNHADAQFWLAEAYAEGSGTKKSAREAIYWYQHAADNKHIGGQSAIGMAYLFGLGVQKDACIAYRWHQKAADGGNPRAQYLLSQQYRIGEGVEKNVNLADKWLKKSAENGWHDAQWDLIISYGKRYMEKGDNPEEMATALEWLEKDVTKNDARAQQLLGWMYQTGTFVPISLPSAVELYSASVNQGNPEAKFSLAVLLAEGIAVEQDCVRALSLLQETADNGMDKSAIVLGNLHRAGLCVPVDYAKTAIWYLQAVKNHYPNACQLFSPPITPDLLGHDEAKLFKRICVNDKGDQPSFRH